MCQQKENDGYGKTDHAQWASPLLARHRFAAVACARCLQTKYVLSNYDNKRYWYSDFESLPFGHYAIKYLHNEKMI